MKLSIQGFVIVIDGRIQIYFIKKQEIYMFEVIILSFNSQVWMFFLGFCYFYIVVRVFIFLQEWKLRFLKVFRRSLNFVLIKAFFRFFRFGLFI